MNNLFFAGIADGIRALFWIGITVGVLAGVVVTLLLVWLL